MISENQSMPTILVADSDDDNRYLLRSLFELKGFHVLLATDGQEAIDTAVRKHPGPGSHSAKVTGNQRLYRYTTNETMRSASASPDHCRLI